MSNYYNGSQEREWPGSEQDPDWRYVCDRPSDDCACELDPNGPLPQSACAWGGKRPGSGRPPLTKERCTCGQHTMARATRLRLKCRAK